jgi:hypothetical protein
MKSSKTKKSTGRGSVKGLTPTSNIRCKDGMKFNRGVSWKTTKVLELPRKRMRIL